MRVPERALLAAVLLWTASHVSAADPQSVTAGATHPSPEAAELRVVVKNAEPFVILKPGAPPAGYSVDVWEEVARIAGLRYTVTATDTAEQMIGSLEEKKADIAVGALSMTSERESRIDFSHSIYDSGLGLMVQSESGGRWLLNFLNRSKILDVLGILFAGIFIAANILWLIHRYQEQDHFPKNYFRGIGESMWWAASVFLGDPCIEKKVFGFWGRLYALFWTLISVTCISYVTATLASSMTISKINSQVRDLSDLKGREIATVGKSEAVDFLSSKGMSAVLCPDLDAAIKLLKAGKVRAVFYDLPILQYQQKLDKEDGLMVLPITYLPHQYGFGLEFKSGYTKIVNEAILTLKENGRLEEIRRKWFGEDPLADN